MCFQEITKVVHFKENGSAAKTIEVQLALILAVQK